MNINDNALNTIMLANDVREVSGIPRALKASDIYGRQYLLQVLINFTYLSRRLKGKISRRIINPYILEPILIILLRIILINLKKQNNIKELIKSIVQTLNVISHRAIFYENIVSPINIEIEESRITDSEINTNIAILNGIGRHGVAIRYLKNLNNKIINNKNIEDSINYFAEEFNETAQELSDKKSKSINFNRPNSSIINNEYLLIIASMDDSAIFRGSVLSLLESDYEGQVVVVEDGVNPSRRCENFCNKNKINYLKLDKHSGPGECFNAGIKRFGQDASQIIYCHNDILWPKYWFVNLRDIWIDKNNYNNIGLINLSYIQYSSGEILNKLFIDGNYDDLISALNYISKVSYLNNSVDEVVVNNYNNHFGIPHDPWNTNYDKFKLMAGRWSVAASVPKEIWVKIGGFSPNVFLADIEIQEFCMNNNKLMLWIPNTPLIHARSSDTNKLDSASFKKFKEMENFSYEYFLNTRGYGIEEFLHIVFNKIYIYWIKKIIRSANEKNFSSVNYIFEEYKIYLSKLKNE